MQIIDGVEYLEVDEAAALLGVKKATLYAYVSRGVLHSFRQAVGRKRLYRRDAIEGLREVRPSDDAAPSLPDTRSNNGAMPNPQLIGPDGDDVVRDVTLPDAASWAGEH
jgi:excisionase family DNA binding protein